MSYNTDIFVDIARAKNDFFNLLSLFSPIFSVGNTPFDCLNIDEETGFRLVKYNTGADDLLIVPSIVNRSYILDLNGDVSVIQQFCKNRKGHFGVYKIEWEYFHDSGVSLSDYVDYVDAAVDKILCKGKKVSILGYCLGGVISLIYAFLHPEKVKKLILLATPIDLSMWFDPRIFFCKMVDPEYIKFFPETVPGRLINAYGMYLLSVYLPLFMMSSDFIEESFEYEYQRDFFRRIRWLIDSQPIPRSVYESMLIDLYQKNSLIDGRVEIRGERIDLSRIDLPLLNIIARYDHIIPYQSSTALEKIYSGKYEEIIFPSSHVGLSVSRKAHTRLWPMVCDWLMDETRIRKT